MCDCDFLNAFDYFSEKSPNNVCLLKLEAHIKRTTGRADTPTISAQYELWRLSRRPENMNSLNAPPSVCTPTQLHVSHVKTSTKAIIIVIIITLLLYSEGY